MDAELDPTERRIVGVLIEKALTTPDLYPLTVNALVNGCNQKNNRDPVVFFTDFEVEGALRALFVKKWVTTTSEIGGRSTKWKHRVDERLDLGRAEMAVICELLLRGPQQPGELRSRTDRMAPLPSVDALIAVLDGLAAKSPPLVVNLGRSPGERADRFAQTLAPDVPHGAAAPGPAPGNVASAPAAPLSPPVDPSLPLATRVARLESEVAALRAAVELLRAREG